MSEERELVTISKITEIAAIPKYDRVELATVENYKVIVKKGEFSVGDLCVYVFYDVVLTPREEIEFLRKSSWSPKYKGFRIREIRMCGVFSSGLILPLSILPASTKVKEGTEVSKALGAVKYDPEAFSSAHNNQSHNKKKYPYIIQKLLRFKLMQRIVFGKTVAKVPYPDKVSQSSEINIQKAFNNIKRSGHVFELTEKIEGQSSCFCLVPRKRKKPEYRLYSHTVMRFKNDNSTWDKISKKFKLEEGLRAYYAKHDKRCLAIEGEICGPGIQRNIYGFPELKYFVFRIYDVETGYVFTGDEMRAICLELSLEAVPVLGKESSKDENFTLENLLKSSDGMSVFGKNVKREGFVLTSVSNPLVRAKVKSIKYKTWWAKEDVTE